MTDLFEAVFKALQQARWSQDCFYKVLQALQQLPAFQELPIESLVYLMSHSIQCVGQHPWCLQAYVALPAAAGITVDQLAGRDGLLPCCSSRPITPVASVWQDLLGLPAAKQISCEGAHSLLYECIKGGVYVGVVALCKLPVLKRGNVAAAIISLCKACMQFRQAGIAGVLVSGLPALQQLTAAQVHELVQLSVQLDCTEVRTALLQLPGAQAAVKQAAVPGITCLVGAFAWYELVWTGCWAARLAWPNLHV